MIEQKVCCEWEEYGPYIQKVNHGYVVHYDYFCIDDYQDVPEDRHWSECPCCGLKPKIWEYDNGRSTACACYNSRCDHFSVHAESIMSVHTRCNGNISEYNSDQLRLNWNEYCATMVCTLNHSDLRMLDRW